MKELKAGEKMPGYFKMDRDIFQNDIWHSIVEFRLFFYLIGQARFNEKSTTKYGVEIKKGQYLRSYRNLQEDLEYFENNAIKQYSLSRIKLAIGRLEEQERVKIEKTRLGTLFTVLNYEQYQDSENYKIKALNEDKTEKKRRKNADKTDFEQTLNNTNNVLRMNKECNNMSPSSEIEKIYNSLTDYWKELFKDYIEIYKSKNTTGKITDNRHYNLLKEINQIYQEKKFEFDKKEYEVTENIIEAGLNKIIEKNISSLNYAKKIWIGELEKKDEVQVEKERKRDKQDSMTEEELAEHYAKLGYR